MQFNCKELTKFNKCHHNPFVGQATILKGFLLLTASAYLSFQPQASQLGYL